MNLFDGLIDYFRYSEGNTQVFFICCIISAVCLLLLIFTIPLGRIGTKQSPQVYAAPSYAVPAANQVQQAFPSAPPVSAAAEPVAQETSGVVFCPECGQQNSADDKFCRHCGCGLE